MSSLQEQKKITRITYLDGWRGLAILLVLYDHFISFGNIKTGRLGVDIFFVLSGFLMSKILFINKVPLSTFYKRRISRILPVFFLFVLVIYSFDFFVLKTGESNNILYTLAFLRSYFPIVPDIWHASLPIAHLWSLNVEEHCYVFLSLLTLLKVLKGREGIFLIFSGILCIMIHIAYIKIPSIAPPNWDLRTEVVASHLLISAGYYLVRHNFTKYIKPWMPLFTFCIAVLCYSPLMPWWATMIISPFMLAFTINHLSETYNFIHKALSLTVLRQMGTWSYSIYLWQHPFYAYRNEFPTTALAMIPAIFLGILSFYYFENPIRTRLNNKW